jgi:hypothetical protein
MVNQSRRTAISQANREKEASTLNLDTTIIWYGLPPPDTLTNRHLARASHNRQCTQTVHSQAGECTLRAERIAGKRQARLRPAPSGLQVSDMVRQGRRAPICQADRVSRWCIPSGECTLQREARCCWPNI